MVAAEFTCVFWQPNRLNVPAVVTVNVPSIWTTRGIVATAQMFVVDVAVVVATVEEAAAADAMAVKLQTPRTAVVRTKLIATPPVAAGVQ